MIPVSVGLEDPTHAEPSAQLEKLLVLVGRVEQHGLTGPLAAQDEHVVVHRPHDEAVDLGLAVLVVHAWPAYGLERGSTINDLRPGEKQRELRFQ